MKLIMFTVRIDKVTKAKLVIKAARAGLSVSEYVRRMLANG